MKLIDVDIQMNELELSNKRLAIENKLDQFILNEPNYFNQVGLIQENQDAYRVLLDAELRKFDIGESLLFLVNNRELKLIEAQVKTIDTKVDLLKK